MAEHLPGCGVRTVYGPSSRMGMLVHSCAPGCPAQRALFDPLRNARAAAAFYRRDHTVDWQPLGEVVEVTFEVVEVTFRYVHADGSEVAPHGVCPICARVPVSDQPVVCAHGVTTR